MCADQADILESVSQLPQLESLHLEFSFNAPKLPLANIPARDIRSFSHLSALTSLTQLSIERNPYVLQDDAEQLVWGQVWPAQRDVLVAALRHLPHLTSFGSSTLTLRVSDLAALTSLTHVGLAALEPPGPTEHQQQQPAALGPGASARGPHQLRELAIGGGSCSIRALACIGAFPLLREARTGVLPDYWCFGPADLSPGGTHLLPDTPQVVRQAVEAVADVRARTGARKGGQRSGKEPRALCITTDVDPLLLPPAPAPLAASPAGGHAVWLRELAPLALPGQRVQLWGLALAAGDLAAMAETFPEAKVWQGAVNRVASQ